jgi:hypothetical protein
MAVGGRVRTGNTPQQWLADRRYSQQKEDDGGRMWGFAWLEVTLEVPGLAESLQWQRASGQRESACT